MTYIANSGMQVLELGWDFARDGGAIGEYEMTNRGSAGRLPLGAIIMDVLFWGSGGTVVESGANISLGYGGEPTYYLGTLNAAAFSSSFAKKSTELLNDNLSSLGSYEVAEFLRDDGVQTDEAVTRFKTNVLRVTDSEVSKVILKISGNTITSGSFVVGVWFYMPSLNSIN